MVALTEGTTSNIVAWETQEYQRFGVAHRMIRTGTHQVETWYSVIFQMIYSMTVLQKHHIY